MGKRVRFTRLCPWNSAILPYRYETNGGSGTNLERLWRFALEFSSSKGFQENASEEVDPDLKRRLWKYLMKHKEIIVRVDGQLHYPAVVDHGESRKKVSSILWQVLTSRIRNPKSSYFKTWTNLFATVGKRYVYSRLKKNIGWLLQDSPRTIIRYCSRWNLTN
jgi:hypothetical protein